MQMLPVQPDSKYPISGGAKAPTGQAFRELGNWPKCYWGTGELRLYLKGTGELRGPFAYFWETLAKILLWNWGTNLIMFLELGPSPVHRVLINICYSWSLLAFNWLCD